MEHQEGFFKGVRDANIYYQYWLPDGEVKAVLLIVHGLAEHGGRYINVVNYFVPLGYAVYALDHIGHGKSDGDRVYVEKIEDYTDTLDIFEKMVREWQPDKPIFLVGHSMGGLIGSLYLIDHQDSFAGAVLSGSGVKVPDNISPMVVSIGKLLSNITPKFGLIGLNASDISRDPEVVDAYVNDPEVYTGKTTARLAAEMLRGMEQVQKDAGKITLPLLLVHGSEDKLVDPDASQMLYDTVSSKDKTLIFYDGYYHEVFNDPEKEKVFADMEAWFDKHLG
jgi:alpha-beta hydrolase superfamily lysophospholipase